MRAMTLLSALVLLWAGTAANADLLAEVYVNGVRQDFHPQARVRDGVAYAPLRAAAEALGAQVTWEEATQRAVIQAGARSATIAASEGIVVTGRLLIPLRRLAEALGADVAWQAEGNRVVIDRSLCADHVPWSPTGEVLTVRQPSALAAELPAKRTPLGIPGDYKPCVALLPNGELLVVAFHQIPAEGGRISEHMFLYRSTDDGETWSDREAMDLLGREPYFSVLSDGTLFITVHLLSQDIRNTDGYIHSYLHRSEDGGRTWTTTKISAQDVPGAPPDAWIHTSRNVLELQDGTLIVGVSAPRGLDYLWRSHDRGRTWDPTLPCSFEGVDESQLWWPFMAETVFWQARNGDLLGLWRVDHHVFPLAGIEPPATRADQYERLIVVRSRDGGRNWAADRELGSHYGEMYPALLKLRDGRLLLTFTVRSERPPLGVHAVLGEETDSGFEFDFETDRIVIDAKTPLAMAQGGGFGPTVQLADGTLVTAYSYRGEDNNTHLEVARWRLVEPDA